MEKRELWTPEKKLSYLPDFPRELFVEEAKRLYKEFLDKRYHVVLVPAPIQMHTGHKIRVAQSHNPGWYSSEVYYAHGRQKRKLAEKSLWRLVNRLDGDLCRGNKPKYNCDKTLRNLIYRRLTDGYIDDEGKRVFPNNDVRAFFGLEKMEDPETERDFDSEEYYDDVPF